MGAMTCVNATRAETQTVLEQARTLGISNILALRGDPPGGVGGFQKTEGGFDIFGRARRFLRSWGNFPSAWPDFPRTHCTDRGNTPTGST